MYNTCIGIFRNLLNKSTFIEVYKLLKSGRSGEHYPVGLLQKDQKSRTQRRTVAQEMFLSKRLDEIPL